MHAYRLGTRAIRKGKVPIQPGRGHNTLQHFISRTASSSNSSKRELNSSNVTLQQPLLKNNKHLGNDSPIIEHSTSLESNSNTPSSSTSTQTTSTLSVPKSKDTIRETPLSLTPTKTKLTTKTATTTNSTITTTITTTTPKKENALVGGKGRKKPPSRYTKSVQISKASDENNHNNNNSNNNKEPVHQENNNTELNQLTADHLMNIIKKRMNQSKKDSKALSSLGGAGDEDTSGETPDALSSNKLKPSVTPEKKTLEDIVGLSVPILSSLASRIQSPETNTIGIKHPQFAYPLNSATLSQLESLLYTHINEYENLQRILSHSLPLLVLSSPVRGSDLYLKAIIKAIASDMKASFLNISNSDLFERKTALEILPITPFEVDVKSDGGTIHEMTIPNFPFIPKSGRRKNGASPSSVTVVMGTTGGSGNEDQVLSKFLKRHGIGGKGDSSEDALKNEVSLDSSPVVFPWYRQYKEPLSTKIMTTPPSESSPHQNIINNAITLFFRALPSPVNNTPLIIFYEDFLKLIESPPTSPRDTLYILNRELKAYRNRYKSPIVLIIPSTPTFKSTPDTTVVFASDTNAEESSAFAEAMETGSKPSSSGKASELDYSHSLEHYLGINTIPIVPPFNQMTQFLDQCAQDAKNIFRSFNTEEMKTIASTMNIQIPKDWGMGVPHAETRELSPQELERCLVTIIQEKSKEKGLLEKTSNQDLNRETNNNSNKNYVNDHEYQNDEITKRALSNLSETLTAISTPISKTTFLPVPNIMLDSLTSHEQKLLAECYIPAGRHLSFILVLNIYFLFFFSKI